MKQQFYATKQGKMLVGDIEQLGRDYLLRYYKGKINLIVTSPPFPLNKKKKYGNHTGNEYLNWFTNLGELFCGLLTDDGSIVIEMGNSWEPNRPVQSLLHLESLFALAKNPNHDLRLIQEFIAYNPAKLPSPAQWVTVERIRTVDSYTHIWWLAKTDFPKADNKKVLRPYSKSMQRLIDSGKYNAGKRPSEHRIGEKSFAKDNGGAIAHNLFELEPLEDRREVRLPHNVLSFANTGSREHYLRRCKEMGEQPHPARMNGGLVNFFIDFLTDEGDIILDPFAGSNTTGFCAEMLSRRWIAVEADQAYAANSAFRFDNPIHNIKLKMNLSREIQNVNSK